MIKTCWEKLIYVIFSVKPISWFMKVIFWHWLCLVPSNKSHLAPPRRVGKNTAFSFYCQSENLLCSKTTSGNLFLGKTNRSLGHKVEHCSCELYAQKNTKSNGAKVWLLSTDVNLVWHWTVIIQIPRLHHSLIDMECLSKNGWWINHEEAYYR